MLAVLGVPCTQAARLIPLCSAAPPVGLGAFASIMGHCLLHGMSYCSAAMRWLYMYCCVMHVLVVLLCYGVLCTGRAWGQIVDGGACQLLGVVIGDVLLSSAGSCQSAEALHRPGSSQEELACSAFLGGTANWCCAITSGCALVQ